MDVLDKADIAEQTAHVGHTEVGTPWENRAARARLIVAGVRSLPDRTVPASDAPHVYLAYSAGRIKVGTCRDLRDRKRGLDGGSPHPVTVLTVWPGSYKLERQAHAALAGVRLHGEWFRLTPGMRQWLKIALCGKGMAKFRRAEASFKKWAREELLGC